MSISQPPFHDLIILCILIIVNTKTKYFIELISLQSFYFQGIAGFLLSEFMQ